MIVLIMDSVVAQYSRNAKGNFVPNLHVYKTFLTCEKLVEPYVCSLHVHVCCLCACVHFVCMCAVCVHVCSSCACVLFMCMCALCVHVCLCVLFFMCMCALCVHVCSSCACVLFMCMCVSVHVGHYRAAR